MSVTQRGMNTMKSDYRDEVDAKYRPDEKVEAPESKATWQARMRGSHKKLSSKSKRHARKSRRR